MSWLSKWWNQATGKDAARQAQSRANQEAQQLEQETDALREQRQAAEAAQERQKKLIEEKQIRSLRRSRRAQGFLASQEDGLKDTLG